MYYSSNKTNSDYYNTYKEEMATLEDYHEGFSFQKIIKIGFTILTIGLLSILSIYLMNHFSINIKERTSTISPYVRTQNHLSASSTFSEEMLPKSIQIEEKNHNISPKDVALIVEIIMAQINSKEYSSLEYQLLSTQEKRADIKTLKETNHYNKVVLSTTNNQDIVDKQIALRADLSELLKDTNYVSSNYEKAIKKEIDSRSNEMRIIIVQKGDTLSKIAKKAYGKFDAYRKILMANPEIVKNPNEIFVGQRLRIPA
jgi:LysM repeat protein